MYIRTEDEVWEINNDMYVKDNEAYMRWFDGRGKEIYATYLGKVVEQSYNLVELCDKFVIVFNNKEIEPRQFAILKTAIDYLKQCDKKYEPKLNGAIWTSKGLIFVTKMNEKGELVLI